MCSSSDTGSYCISFLTIAIVRRLGFEQRPLIIWRDILLVCLLHGHLHKIEYILFVSPLLNGTRCFMPCDRQPVTFLALHWMMEITTCSHWFAEILCIAAAVDELSPRPMTFWLTIYISLWGGERGRTVNYVRLAKGVCLDSIVSIYGKSFSIVYASKALPPNLCTKPVESRVRILIMFIICNNMNAIIDCGKRTLSETNIYELY